MQKRDANLKGANNLGLRRAFLLGFPLILAGGAWKIREVQKPIDVEIPSPGLQRNKEDGSFSLKTQKIPTFQQLIDRLLSESRQYPFASYISISQTTPWPKESGLNLRDSEVLIYNRKNQTLEYSYSAGPGGYGWTFGKVRISDFDFLSRAKIRDNALYLSPQIQAALLKRGCVLVDKSLP